MSESNAPVKIIIADNHVMFLEGLKSILQKNPSLVIVDIAYDGKELLDILHRVKSDIVLLDIHMPPHLNGIEVCRFIKISHPSVKVIMLTTYNEGHLVEQARQNGASGYVIKNSPSEELINAVVLVSQGKTYFPDKPARGRKADIFNEKSIDQFKLSRREKEVARLIKEGLTNSQMAERLSLEVDTVETHRKNLKRKLGIKSNSDLMRFLFENDI